MRDVFNSLDIGWGLCRTFPREMLKRISDEIKEVFYDREAGAQVRIFFFSFLTSLLALLVQKYKY
jgi:hypothetical protein